MPINPSDLQHVFAAAHSDNDRLVDHQFHLDKHPDEDTAKDYRDNVVGAPHAVSALEKGLHPHARFVSLPTGTIYHAQPYHSTIPLHLAHVTHYPLAGWAQMTAQALYHAGGLGHLIEHSHVVEHARPDGAYEPLLVTRHAQRFERIENAHHAGAPSVMADAAKMGLIDYLTNHQGRHPYSMLLSGAVGTDPAQHIVGIGHQDAFQYKRPNRWQKHHTKFDHLMYYLLDSPGMAALAHDDKRVYDAGPMQDAVQWWQANGRKLRTTLGEHLAAIQSPEARRHIASHFNDRAAGLDRFALAWPEIQNMEQFSPYHWNEPDTRPTAGTTLVPVYKHTPKVS